jgi:hypothetical protein
MEHKTHGYDSAVKIAERMGKMLWGIISKIEEQ